jgi:sec-independent protein translocase protein TatB
MFGIEFSEFLIIGIVALIVLGPERLPKVARTAGHLFGRLQRYAADIKQQVKTEMEAEDLKNLQAQFQEVKDAASGVENSIRQEAAQTETQVMSAIDAPPLSSLEFVEHAEVPAAPVTPVPDASPQLELPLASAEPAQPAAADKPA